MALVFISYKRQNSDLALLVKNTLEDRGFTCWLDTNKLTGGVDWRLVIDNTIKEALAVILIVTPQAMASHFVTYEWAFAMGVGKRVIPLIFEDPDDANPMHPALEVLHRYDFKSDKKPWDEVFKTLEELTSTTVIPDEITDAARILRSVKPRSEWQSAVNTLEKYDHPAAIEELAKGTNSGITEIQGLCALALARKTNYKDDRPVKALGKVLLENSNLTSSEQREVLDTLGIIASDPAVTILMDLYYTDPSSTPDIFRNIRRSKNVIAKEFLRELFSKGHQTEDIIFTLGEFKDELVLDQMRILANNERNQRIRAAAIVSWAKISGERVLPELKDTLNGMIRTDGGPIPQAYIDAIISIETDETKDFLNEIMRKYPNTWLSRVIKGRLEGPQF